MGKYSVLSLCSSSCCFQSSPRSSWPQCRRQDERGRHSQCPSWRCHQGIRSRPGCSRPWDRHCHPERWERWNQRRSSFRESLNLTTVLPPLPRTEHAVRYGEGILQPAGPVLHHGHVHLHQLHGAATPAGLESPPARYSAGALGGLLLCGKAHCSNIFIELEGLGQFPDSDVILVVLRGAVVLMDGETDHPPPLLSPLLHTAVVFPSHHLHLASGPVGAMGGCDHVAGTQDGATAEMEVVRLPPEAHLEGDRVRLSLLSAYNPASLALPSDQAEAAERTK